MRRPHTMDSRIPEEGSVTDGSSDQERNTPANKSSRDSPDTTASSNSTTATNTKISADADANANADADANNNSDMKQLDDDVEGESSFASFEGDSDYDSEANDEFSVSLNSEGVANDSASAYSLASSAATDDQSLDSQTPSTVGSNTTDSELETQRIARREAKAARWGRYSIFSLLLLVGCMLPFMLYHVASIREQAAFGDFFDDFSDEVGVAWLTNTARAFTAMDGMAIDITMATAASAWPLVTLEMFPIWSTNARAVSTALLSNTLAPIVTDVDRQAYETFVQDNQDWISQSEQWVSSVETDDGSQRRHLQQQVVDFSKGTSNDIYVVVDGTAIVAPGPGPFYPIRHLDPISLRSLNFNLVSSAVMIAELKGSTAGKLAVLGRLLEEDSQSTILKGVLLPQSNNDRPDLFGTMTYPVFESLAPGGTNVTVVGSLVSMISWTELVANVLPAHAQGIVAVIENSCGQVASLQLDGPEVTFLGYGDFHDTEFSGYGRTYDLEAINLQSTTALGLPLDEDICPFTMTVYPAVTTQEAYITNTPVVYAAIAVCAFVLTILLVVIYDYILERRSHEILKSAMEARAIVSSLFPANVRDRLFETNREKEKKKKKEKRKLKRRHKKKKKQLQKEAAKNGLGIVNESAMESPNKRDMEYALNSPLSPATVQSLLESVNPPMEEEDDLKKKRRSLVSHPKHRLKKFLANSPAAFDDRSDEFRLAKPIADLFPHCTVFFADIVGFTAWSSEREPEDVFTLLQTIYHAFDKIARRRSVFKVETIGDCYVAVTGLPDPQPDHAVRMTKFGRECCTKMTEVTKKLEVSLGPDTGDLCMRLGLNSGPVTAGVLQGEKSRFQLFGDTVNTASRMESTGEKNQIQLSKSTADLLIAAGKGYWVKPRDDLVHAKGKGNVQTFWLVSRSTNFTIQVNKSADAFDNEIKRVAPPRTRSAFTTGGPVRGVNRATSDYVTKVDNVVEDMVTQGRESNDKREERLIQWQVELFIRLLKKIVAAREDVPITKKKPKNGGWDAIPRSSSHSIPILPSHSIAILSDDSMVRKAAPAVDRFPRASGPGMTMPPREPSFRMPKRRPSAHSSIDVSVSTFHSSFADPSAIDSDMTVVDEVVEIIRLPKFNLKSIKASEKSQSIELDDVVLSQLKDYISTIAHMYRQNPFHNFEHASHVTMSANKLLNRIVIPENVDYERESDAIASDLHDYTYGITSDPLTQFAVVFSALVHDVDHTGVPNGQLSKENPDMAAVYRNQSVAEQNSVDLAWDLFLDPRYKKLQDCIAANDDERKRFRQLVVNSVLATDIFDKDMKGIRDKRWDKAFRLEVESDRHLSENFAEEDRNMKATIVIEHIIQASDVAHTMQHWHIYQKWNERLFDEMYSAFECGRSANNPAEGWYKGELWFFDNYVIPLAKKLEECNVFGVASDECLTYAQANRNEWSIKGEETVQEMVSRYNKRKFFVAGMAKKRHPNKLPSRMVK